MKKENLILIGGGGHCKSCIDVIEQEGRYEIKGIVDRKENIGKKVLGYEIIACDDDLEALAKVYDCFLITLGQLKSSKIRVKLYEALKVLQKKMPVVVSPRAYVSPHARIEEGTIIMHDVVVNAGAKIGYNSIVNTKALLEHDACVGNHNHISTKAVLNGDVKVGDKCTIGSNSTVIQGIEIGNEIVVGAGAVVTRNLEKPGIYIGIPVKRMH
jgi:sugar O-acyltransferase (sialic acid O-acetyltransferase NeuD family)